MKAVKQSFNYHSNHKKRATNKRRANLRNRMADKASRTAATSKTKRRQPPKRRDISHWGVIKKLDTYERLALSNTQIKGIQDIQKDYEAGESKKPNKRAQRNHNFYLGHQKGLHLDVSYQDMQNQDKMIDQNDRRAALKKAKNFYNQHYGLNKDFGRANPKNKSRDKEMDKER